MLKKLKDLSSQIKIVTDCMQDYETPCETCTGLKKCDAVKRMLQLFNEAKKI
jgi:hypothetical protein